MNTEQSYPGKGNSATPTSRAAKKGSKLNVSALDSTLLAEIRQLLSESSEKVIVVVIDQSVRQYYRVIQKGNGNAVGSKNTTSAVINQ